MNQSEMSDVNVKERVRDHWSGRAPEYDERPHHAIHTADQRQAWLALLTRVLGSSEMRVLDIGCGTGFLSLLLAELGHDVTGVDIAPDMLAIAKQKASEANLGIDLRVGDAELVDDPDDTYDLIIERHVIWTLPSPIEAVHEWIRALKPDGRLVFIEGHWGDQSIKAEYEEIRDRLPFYGGIPSVQLAEFLQAQGLREVTVELLDDETLWGESSQRERYLVTGLTCDATS